MTDVPAWSSTSDPALIAQHVKAFRPEVLAKVEALPGESDLPALERLKKIYNALWIHPIGYSFEHPASTGDAQQVRSPEEVLGRPGHGTCLDIAVMFASACNHAGLPAAIVIIDRTGTTSRTRHALVAVHIGDGNAAELAEVTWKSPPTNFVQRALVDLDGPPRDWAIVDVVGVASAGEVDASTDMKGLGASFADALSMGYEYLTDESDWSWEVAVNTVIDPGETFVWTPRAPADHAIGPLQHVGPVDLPLRRKTITSESEERLIGRESALKELAVNLDDGADEVTVVFGLGGVGKTALALEYAHRFSNHYSLIWWVDGENVSSSYSRLASALRLQVSPDKTEDAVQAHLRSRKNWLCVFDNAEHPSDLVEFRKDVPTGKLVVTSRADTEDWPNPIKLGKLSAEESESWLSRVAESVRIEMGRTSGPSGADENEAAAEIAELLDGLALALSMAAAYIRINKLTLTDYLDRYKRRAEALLGDKRFLEAGDNAIDRTVYTTWNVSVDALQAKQAHKAIEILEIISFYAPNNIPLFLFDEENFGLDPIDLDAAINELRDFSLVERSGDFISLHRLVQDVTRYNLMQPVPTAPE